MQAVILLGGQGTRLQALYPDRPKALVPILDKPFLEWQTDLLVRQGIRKIHLAAGYKADMLERWIQQQTRTDVKFTISKEPKPLGTGGGLKFVEPYLSEDFFFVLNGDSVLPSLDFQALVLRSGLLRRSSRFGCEGWKEAPLLRRVALEKIPILEERSEPDVACPPSLATRGSRREIFMAVTQIQEAGRFGTVEFDASGRVTAFREKAERTAGWVNGGVYVMHKKILATMEMDKNISMETELFPMLVEQGNLFAFPTKPPLLDMGTPDGLKAMEAFFAV